MSSHASVSELVATIKDGMTLKFVHPPDAKTQAALAALKSLVEQLETYRAALELIAGLSPSVSSGDLNFARMTAAGALGSSPASRQDG